MMADSKGANSAFQNAWRDIAPSVGASAQWGKAGFKVQGRRQVAFGQAVKIEFELKADPKFKAFLRRLDVAHPKFKKEYKRILRTAVRKEVLPTLKRNIPRSSRRKKHIRGTAGILSVNMNRAIIGVGGSKNWYGAIIHAGPHQQQNRFGGGGAVLPMTFRQVWHPLNRRLIREMYDLMGWLETGHKRRRGLMARWDRRTRLLAELGLRDETKRGLASASRGFQTYLSGNSRAAGMAGMAVSGALSGNAAFAAAGMGSAFLTMAGTSLSAFVEMEKKWAEVTTLMPQMNEEALGVMKQQIDRFARETGTTLADAYQATYQAVSAGIEPGQTESFLRVAHTAATAGVTDLTTAVDGITSALNAYGLETREAIRLSDDMFTAVRLGKTTFGEMAASLGLVMPLASSMNTEFRELAAASAALTAQGNTQAIATTQIRAALVALSKDTKAARCLRASPGCRIRIGKERGAPLRRR